MKHIEEILENSKNEKINIPESFTNTILNFSPNTLESRKWLMKFNIKRKIVAVLTGTILLSGAVFAGNKVYEKIWKDPEKIEVVTQVITPEAQKENISETEAKQIAINKLNQIGFNTNIIKTDNYKEVDSNKIMYRFITQDGFSISIDGQKAKFYDIWNESGKIKDINNKLFDNNWKLKNNISQDYFMSKEEAIQQASEYFKLFDIREEEYEITQIIANTDYSTDAQTETGYVYNITYNKKYGDTYNPYEYVTIEFYAKDKTLYLFRTESIPYDNNSTEITKEQALQIALEIDKKIEDKEIIETKVEKMIVKMNAKAYFRLTDKERFYKEMSTVDYPQEERVYYQMEDRIRNAWVVDIKYINDWPDIVTSCTRGEFSYFIDSTTGEIIGGDVGDYIRYR